MPRTPVPSEPSVPSWQTLADFTLPSQPGSDRQAREQVAVAVERLKTAVTEATLNAIEHGNRNRPELPVNIRLLVSEKALAVQITDQGHEPIPSLPEPDVASKVAGQEPTRGWGLFLIERMVDDLQITADEAHHTVELFLYLEGNGS
jgi:anti-sigma regulatory factor (Ser/Thr protein kinase)